MNNLEEEPVTYAMIPFVDFHQIQINGQNTFVWQAAPNDEAIIDAKITLPKEVGVRQLQWIYLFDPHKSVLRKEVLAPFVFRSPRIAIAAH
jgi:hypothetical protein